MSALFLGLACLLPGSTLPGRSDEPVNDKADTAFKQPTARMADDKAKQEQLRPGLAQLLPDFSRNLAGCQGLGAGARPAFATG